MLLEGVEVAERGRHRHRREQPHRVDLDHLVRIPDRRAPGGREPLAVVAEEVDQPGPPGERVKHVPDDDPDPVEVRSRMAVGGEAHRRR